MKTETKGMIFDIQRWSLHDGPGIRTNVFFKGCPLTCLWCSNPESQEFQRELVYFPDKCIGCGSCVQHCPHQAVSRGDEGMAIDYGVCRRFCHPAEDGFACVSACYAKALDVMGKAYTVEELMKEVMSDAGIYESSGGGMTVTGGEPLAQPGFLLELLKAAKERGLHTVMETSGQAGWEDFKRCLEYLDFLFMDFKVYDGEAHRRYTGVDNRQILENMKRVNEYAGSHRLTFVIRTPVIPGVNDSEEEIGRIADFIKEQLSQVRIYQLLPYHRLGRGKYGSLGKEYRLEDLEAPEDETMRRLEEVIPERGLRIKYE